MAARKARPPGANLGATTKTRPLGATLPRTSRRTGATSRSGSNISEAERGTEAIKLRLSPDDAAQLRALGAAHPRGLSGVVTDWLATLR